MPVDIAAIVSGISQIPTVYKSFRDTFSSLKKETKDEGVKTVLKEVESKLLELDNKFSSINEGAFSVNAYFELYGHALDLYTTADDFIKIILKAPEQTRDLVAYTNYNNLYQKFDIGLDPFLSRFNGHVDKEDEGVIRTNTNIIRDSLAAGKVLLETKNYRELEMKLADLTRITNQLRGMSRAKLLRLVDELQKVGNLKGINGQ